MTYSFFLLLIPCPLTIFPFCSSTITSPEEVQSDVSHVTTGFESNPLSAVDNLLSLDEEIKEMEKLWKKSSIKSPIPTSKEASAEKLGDKGLSSSKGLPAPAILSQWLLVWELLHCFSCKSCSTDKCVVYPRILFILWWDFL